MIAAAALLRIVDDIAISRLAGAVRWKVIHESPGNRSNAVTESYAFAQGRVGR